MGSVTFDFTCPINKDNLQKLRLQVTNAQHFQRELGRWLRESKHAEAPKKSKAPKEKSEPAAA